jgi:hypothetical protein
MIRSSKTMAQDTHRLKILGSYLVFREADRAYDQGTLSVGMFQSIGDRMRAREGETCTGWCSFRNMFPGHAGEDRKVSQGCVFIVLSAVCWSF